MKTWKLNNGYIIYQVLNGRCNSFLISTPNGNVIVDTGMKRNLNRLLKNINSVNLHKPNIDFLILTHSHFDHCRNALFLKNELNCKVIASEKEADYTLQGYTALPKGTNPITMFLSSIGKK